MRYPLFTALALALLLSPAAAQNVVKTEPAPYTTPPGTAVYVDDGSCPRGKIKLLRAGSPKHGLKRQRECVARPAGI